MSIHGFAGRKGHHVDASHAVIWVNPETSCVKRAVEAGCIDTNEFTYVGRVTLPNGDTVPGTVYPARRVCVAVHDGKVIESPTYDMLINTEEHVFESHWSALSFDGSMPSHSVKAGKTASGEAIYVARAPSPIDENNRKTHGGHYVCAVQEGQQQADIAYEGQVHQTSGFKILCTIHTHKPS